MATHHGKEGVVHVGGTNIGNATEIFYFYLQTALTQGSSLSFEFMPEGADSGDRKFSGTGIVTGMSVGVTLDGVTTRTVSLQGTGGLTIGTV